MDLVLVLIIAIVIVFIAMNIFRSVENNKMAKQKNFGQIAGEREVLKSSPSQELLTTLGLVNNQAAPLRDKLNAAWDEQYAAGVKKRLIEKNIISEDDYKWYELELKRFFLLSAVMKNVPMYNSKVDAIWHDMILFTKEYSVFCDVFNRGFIHHMPSVDREKTEEKASHERAVFELFYTAIFSIHERTDSIHGGFFQNRLDKSFLTKLNELTGDKLNDWLDDELFKFHHPDSLQLIQDIRETLKKQAKKAALSFKKYSAANNKNTLTIPRSS
ncbi:glycine-rich domain-containing protein [Domibacillus epiphyticus]|uniref:Uncharacterized protein n=1 Tax=Domibacillus epiphyticus TaxID=1714355 RepID=A0A1V2A635_9BACI|nr:hypothetical protein [Domibacillus epiphyticus]OMP66322.1 hypothetical protein BTO28_12720 [Domibacillus epiphyticus]